jgi:hypothetical protein
MQTEAIQIQNDVTGKLTVSLMAWGITVKSQRAMIISNEVDEAQLVMTITNGKSGAGCLVQMPRFSSESANAPGPLGYWELTVTVKEAPELNMNASTGTLKSAEEISRRVMQILHLMRIQNIGTFYASGDAIARGPTEPGIISYDVKVRMQFGIEVLAVSPNPTITGTPSAVTVDAGEGTTCYYTIDGESFPGPDMPNAMMASGTFAVPSGTIVRAASYIDGYIGSDVIEATIT